MIFWLLFNFCSNSLSRLDLLSLRPALFFHLISLELIRSSLITNYSFRTTLNIVSLSLPFVDVSRAFVIQRWLEQSNIEWISIGPFLLTNKWTWKTRKSSYRREIHRRNCRFQRSKLSTTSWPIVHEQYIVSRATRRCWVTLNRLATVFFRLNFDSQKLKQKQILSVGILTSEKNIELVVSQRAFSSKKRQKPWHRSDFWTDFSICRLNGMSLIRRKKNSAEEMLTRESLIGKSFLFSHSNRPKLLNDIPLISFFSCSRQWRMLITLFFKIFSSRSDRLFFVRTRFSRSTQNKRRRKTRKLTDIRDPIRWSWPKDFSSFMRSAQ